MSYTLNPSAMPSKIMYINSEDASQYLATKLNTDGTTSPLNCYFNYIVKENIEIPLNQRALISLSSATIPYSFYNIRDDINDILDISVKNITEGTQKDYLILIPKGNYDVYSFAEFIVAQTQSIGQDVGDNIEYTLAMDYSQDTQKYTYTFTPINSAVGDRMSIDFLFFAGLNNVQTCNVEMGFRIRDVKIDTITSNTVVSDNVVDINGSIHGVYIRTNLVSDGTLDSQNGVFSNILARLPINVNPGGIIFATPNNATHKSVVDLRSISQLTIRLTDDRNRLLDLNGLHFQIAIEINFLYGQKPMITPDGRNHNDSFYDSSYGPKSDIGAQQTIINAQQRRNEELKEQKKNRRGVGRPRNVGRPKGS